MDNRWFGARFALLIAFIAIAPTESATADSYWRTPGGSVAALTQDGNDVEIRFVEVSSTGSQRGVSPGTVTFRGKRRGDEFVGTGLVFPSRDCRILQPWRIEVDGDYLVIHGDSSSIVRKGDCQGTQAVPDVFKWGRVNGLSNTGPVASSVEIGRSVDIGQPVETGRSVDIGTSVETGQSVDIGTSVETGTSTEIGVPSETGASTGIGKSVAIGSSVESSQPLPEERVAMLPSSKPTGGENLPAQMALRKKLWPVKGVPGSMDPLAVNREKVGYDWEAIQLARAAYSDNLPDESTVFKNTPNWVVAHKKQDTESGFLAYTFVNEKEHRVVVGIQGSRNPIKIVTPGKERNDAIRDWSGDAQAVAGGSVPRQFSEAQQYLTDVKKRYGKDYVIDCAGHSMGGGACVYAGSQVSDVHVIAIDPISSGSLATNNAYQIDNYFPQGDIARTANQIFERGGTGWPYVIKDRPGAVAFPSGAAQTTPSTIPDPGGPVARHSVDRAIDALGKETGLVPYPLANE